MKRYLIWGAIISGLLTLFLLWPGREGTAPNGPDAAGEAPTVTASNVGPGASRPVIKNGVGRADQNPLGTEAGDDPKQRFLGPEALRAFNEAQNVPVAFYGQVVDQNTNALQNVTVDLEVLEQFLGPFPKVTEKTTHLQRQTGADGRFEVTGLVGHTITVKNLTKEGYEPELMQKSYGTYYAQSTSVGDPKVFRMWSTSIHNPLVAGEKSFDVVPDGRHYAVDLLKGTIAEGDEGDLVVWIKRPKSVKWGEKYDWSCELALPLGGLLEGQSPAMSIAPEAGYTRAFAYQEETDSHWWSGGFANKRFYVLLRDGQMYGRITVGLYADFHRTNSGLIQLSYVTNPSGSRLLR